MFQFLDSDGSPLPMESELGEFQRNLGLTPNRGDEPYYYAELEVDTEVPMTNGSVVSIDYDFILRGFA